MSSEARTDEDDRIEQLEARVEELEAQDSLTSGTVPISRRGLLQGGAALGIGALGGSVLGGENSGRVAAQTASGQVGTDSDRVDVYGNLVDAASVNVGAVNNIKYVDPSVSDIGSELNSMIANSSAGAYIVVPPGSYTTSETIVLDKDVTVMGPGSGFRRHFSEMQPEIQADSGVSPVIEVSGEPHLEDLHVNAGDNSVGVYSNWRFSMEGVNITHFSDTGIHLHERAGEGDNLNGTHITATTLDSKNAANNGLLVDAEEGTDTNGCTFELPDIFNVVRGVVLDGDGNYCRVGVYDPNGDLGGGEVAVSQRGNRSEIHIGYAEGGDYAYEEDDDGGSSTAGYSHVVVGEFNADELVDLNKLGDESRTEVKWNGGTVNTREVVSSHVENDVPGEGIVVTTPDGSEQYNIRVDNDGNVEADGPI